MIQPFGFKTTELVLQLGSQLGQLEFLLVPLGFRLEQLGFQLGFQLGQLEFLLGQLEFQLGQTFLVRELELELL